jgi:hypothetical protein
VLTPYTLDAFKDEFGEDPATWPKDIRQDQFDWCTGDVVYVAEFYEVEQTSTVMHVFAGLIEGEEMFVPEDELTPEKEVFLQATGFRKVRDKRVKTRRVHKYLMSGRGILKDCGYIAGKHIPIVPVYGKRWFVDGVERCMGHVRLAKDVARLKNMQLSRLGEISAMSPIEKPIFDPEQIKGLEQMWADDPVENYPYMLARPIKDAEGNIVQNGPIGYTKAPSIPPAMAALLQIVEQDMQDVLGNQQAGEQLQPNMSGKAVELIQNRLDMQTFIYMSNMAKAIKRAGEIWLSMAKDLYFEEGRAMKTVGVQGEIGSAELMRPVYDKAGTLTRENDLSKAKHDVAVDVGPSSSSRRAATVRALTGMMAITSDPETQKVLQAMAMMNMEGEGIAEARDYFRQMLVRMGVVKPTDAEQEEMAKEAANAQPDPNTVYLEAAAEEAQAKAGKAQADTVLTLAKAEQSKAETARTLSEMKDGQRASILSAAQQLQQVFSQPNSPSIDSV